MFDVAYGNEDVKGGDAFLDLALLAAFFGRETGFQVGFVAEVGAGVGIGDGVADHGLNLDLDSEDCSCGALSEFSLEDDDDFFSEDPSDDFPSEDTSGDFCCDLSDDLCSEDSIEDFCLEDDSGDLCFNGDLAGDFGEGGFVGFNILPGPRGNAGAIAGIVTGTTGGDTAGSAI